MFTEIAYAAEKVAEHAVGAGTLEPVVEESVLSSLGLNPTLFIFQLINFAVVAVVIWFLILKPLTKKMSERQSTIEKSLKNAEAVEENLRKSEQKYQEKIDEAKVEAATIIEKSGMEAKELGEKMKNKSKQEIEQLIVQVKKNILIEKEEWKLEILNELYENIGNFFFLKFLI